jgi:hypothetical protein
MVWEENFPFENVNEISLAALGICIAHDGDVDRTKKLVKEAKDKRQKLLAYFPPWLCHESKDKKSRKRVVETMEQYRGQNKMTLELWFLRECLKWEFFGAPEFPVKCVVPGSGRSEREDVLFTITEGLVYLRDPVEKVERFQVRMTALRKWRRLNEEQMVFQYLDAKKELLDLNVYLPNVVVLLEQFTAFVQFLKEQRVAARPK